MRCRSKNVGAWVVPFPKIWCRSVSVQYHRCRLVSAAWSWWRSDMPCAPKVPLIKCLCPLVSKMRKNRKNWCIQFISGNWFIFKGKHYLSGITLEFLGGWLFLTIRENIEISGEFFVLLGGYILDVKVKLFLTNTLFMESVFKTQNYDLIDQVLNQLSDMEF